ncbi:hypothetical protein [Methylophilus sp. Leaf414]|uniref:hypothetical protein n=1 Tax=Methylophilus sp. Leaf414 TaxID=1736371 RepID=UPI0006F829D3|nr:hypothetical protein [Methylophilus sp. Leaf414]KQT38215.1 hypothetical protein ASG24_04480 [Methylophilus sp. Leaf414]
MARLSEAQNVLIEASVPLVNGHKVVLLDVGGRKDVPLVEYNQNIYCVDDFGNIVWQVDAPTSQFSERDSFVGVFKNKEGLLRADRFGGNEYVIDPKTGKANYVGWHK